MLEKVRVFLYLIDMKAILAVLVALVIYGSVDAQVRPADISLGIDIGNTRSGIFENSQREKRKIALFMEYSINDVISLEAYSSLETNDYFAYGYQIGLGAGGSWGSLFDHFYNTNYIGARIYPVENFSSQALQLRGKKNYGFYVSLGYRSDHYRRNEYLLTQVTQTITNTDGSTESVTVTDRFDTFGYDIRWGGMNFGGGFKLYHSKYMSSDLGIYTSAFFNEAVLTPYYNVNGSRRIISEPVWDNITDNMGAYISNGRGAEVRIVIAVNLDIRK